MSAGAQGHESGAQEEIAKIMSEIDDLRKEMEEASENVSSDAVAPEVEASFDEPSETDASPALGAVAEAASAAAEAMAGTPQSAAAEAADEDDILRSGSQRGSQEPSLEETLGDLEEEEAQGDSLLSQSITTTAATADAHAEDASEDDGGQSLTQQLKPEFERAKNAVSRESSRLRSLPVGPVPPVASHSGHGNLTLQVSGNLQLKLQFEAGQREVTLQIEDETFVVRMSDGTEFRMPMAPASSSGKLRVV